MGWWLALLAALGFGVSRLAKTRTTPVVAEPEPEPSAAVPTSYVGGPIDAPRPTPFQSFTPVGASGNRGIRNNNPGNIRRSGDAWQGLAEKQTDPAFFIFTDAKWGIRAMGKILLNYERLYGLHTVRQLIGRWAPPQENDTDSYVDHVATLMGVSPDARLDVKAQLPKLANAIIWHENGENPYPMSSIIAWVGLA